jgi:hypothetical protein
VKWLDKLKSVFHRRNLRSGRILSEDKDFCSPCCGCSSQPQLTMLAKHSYHIQCINPACPSPHMTSFVNSPRDFETALEEWNFINEFDSTLSYNSMLRMNMEVESGADVLKRN